MLTILAIPAIFAVQGHVAPRAQPTPEAVGKPAAVCLFQVPSSMHWVNLYALQQVKVRERAKVYGQPLYSTVVIFSRYDALEFEMVKGADIGIISDAILKRLNECKEGR